MSAGDYDGAEIVPEERRNRTTLETILRDELIVVALAVLLALDLLFLPWFQVTIVGGGIAVPISDPATGAPDGWLGVLAVLAAVALLADLAIERLSPQTQVPAIGESRARTRMVLAVTAAALLAFKLLIHFGSAGGTGFWCALLLAGGLVYATRRVRWLEARRR